MVNKNIRLKVKEKPIIQKKITTDFIRLDSFLKLCDAVQSGGHAKLVIQENEVKVNSEICSQRGKKLHPGDMVEFENTVYEIV